MGNCNASFGAVISDNMRDIVSIASDFDAAEPKKTRKKSSTILLIGTGDSGKTSEFVHFNHRAYWETNYSHSHSETIREYI